MSDLGAIFHVTADGKQYDVHAYTTTDECPEPNLKIKFKGSPAYIKLEAKGSGDVPCYVKKSDGGVFQVKKEAGVPTGNIIIDGAATFIVPSGINVIEIYIDALDAVVYVGVTPNTTHTIYMDMEQIGHFHWGINVRCSSHNKTYVRRRVIVDEDGEEPSVTMRISWSSEINKHAPNVTDY